MFLLSRSSRRLASPLSSLSSAPSAWPRPLSTQAEGAFNLHNLFAVSPELKKRTEASRPHVVFLEGQPGCGKVDTLWRLHKMGFAVHATTYNQLSAKYYPHLPPLSTALNAVYLASMLDWLAQRLREADQGKRFQGNTLFVHRSPLSLDLHAELFGAPTKLGRRVLAELREHKVNLSLINCWADDIRQLERLGERNFLAEGASLKSYEATRDFDREWIERKKAAYDAWAAQGSFDAALPTTSTKQATAQILTLLGVPFDPVFAMDSLNKD